MTDLSEIDRLIFEWGKTVTGVHDNREAAKIPGPHIELCFLLQQLLGTSNLNAIWGLYLQTLGLDRDASQEDFLEALGYSGSLDEMWTAFYSTPPLHTYTKH